MAGGVRWSFCRGKQLNGPGHLCCSEAIHGIGMRQQLALVNNFRLLLTMKLEFCILAFASQEQLQTWILARILYGQVLKQYAAAII